MDYLATLNALAPRFQLTQLPSGSSPLEPSFAIQAPTELRGPDGFALAETVQEITEVPGLPTTYDFTLAVKQVRFLPTDPVKLANDPATEDPIGGMPISLPLVLPTGVLNVQLPPNTLMFSEANQANVPGIPGLLTRINGTIKPTVEKATEVIKRSPITIEVKWRIYDLATNSFATDLQYRHTVNAAWQPLPAGELVKPATQQIPEPLLLQFPIVFADLTSAIPPVRSFSLQASVKLSVTVGGQKFDTDWVDLPAVPLAIPSVPIPTILVLFEHRSFTGRVFVCVPSGSLVGAPPQVRGAITLKGALDLAVSVLRTVLPASPLIGFLGSATGQTVAGLVTQDKQIIIAARSVINNLGEDDYAWDKGGLFGIGRFAVEDRTSSIVAIGPPGTVFDLFADRDRTEGITRFQITIPAGPASPLGIAITKLDLPMSTVGQDVTYGGTITSARPTRGYEDIISSMEIKLP